MSSRQRRGRRTPGPRPSPPERTAHRRNDREAFRGLVARAVASLPVEFKERLENVEFIVEDVPRGDELPGRPDTVLLGLYQGIPLTQRGPGYAGVLPDRIVIFRRPIEARSSSSAELADLVRQVVIHEVAHYFGIDDDRLDELGW